MGFLQMIKSISISYGVPTFLPPLGFILFITAVKDFTEDYNRKKSDNEENMRIVEVWNPDLKFFDKVE